MVSGEPSELLLWLWGRRPDTAVSRRGRRGPAGRAARAAARRHAVAAGGDADVRRRRRGPRRLRQRRPPRTWPRAGCACSGLDPRPGAHAEGASHGETRIVRQVYFEGAAYVPLLLRSVRAVGRARGRRPASRCCAAPAGCTSGCRDTRVFRGSLETARHWDLPHEVLDGAEVHGRFPALRPPDGVVGLWEPEAGTCAPGERGRGPAAAGRAPAGAELRHDEAVTGWSATDDGVRVTTTRGSHEAGALVLAPGRWTADLLGGLDLPLTVERRVQHWFAPPSVDAVPAGPAAGVDLGPRRRDVAVRRPARRATPATSRRPCTSRPCDRPDSWSVPRGRRHAWPS